MKTIKAKFRIVTPMFLGDAEQKATSIRPPSIKGALRFWWRALNWKRAVERHPNDEDAALRWLHDEEARLFGIAADDDRRSGQGIFLLNVSAKGPLSVYQAGNELFKGRNSGTEYLMGQGLWHFRDKLTRSAIKENQAFEVALAFKPNAHKDDIQSVIDALVLFGLLGGLGSRSRHGFGSVQIESMESVGIELPVDIQNIDDETAYSDAVKKVVGDTMDRHEPPLSAFSALAVSTIVKRGRKVQSLLNAVGEEMQLYRSWGRNGKVNGKPSEQNFREDHDNVKNMNLQHPPRRTVFGLPHNYFFSSSKESVEINAYFGNTEARRASPLLLHVHRLKNDEYIAVHTFLPSLFLPENATIRAKKKVGRRVESQTTIDDVSVDWSVIENYLARFDGQQRILP